MAVDWKLVEEALVTFVSNASGTPRIPVNFANQAAHHDAVVYCELEISAVAKDGEDRVIRTQDLVTERNDITVKGSRSFTVTCQFRSLDQSAVGAARAYACRVEMALEHPVLAKVLLDAGISVTDSEPIQNVDEWEDGLLESREILSLFCSVGACIAPDPAQPELQEDYVRSVEVSGDLNHSEGDANPVVIPSTTITE